MAPAEDIAPKVSLTLSAPLYAALHSHLFRGDHAEHGAVLLCGMHQIGSRVRLLARELVKARDGIDFVRGPRGAYKLLASFIEPLIDRCAEERLVYLTVHNHAGDEAVSFSGTDLKSHKNGYPALLDIAGGMPVGALVFANRAVAGDIWLSQTLRVPLSHATVVGSRRRVIRDRPISRARKVLDTRFDRQVRLFGSEGQAILAESHVAVIGAGGVGSLLVELLSRLGVGELTVVDPERIESTNLPRLPGARDLDAGISMPRLLKRLGFPAYLVRPTLKVDYAKRIARHANKGIAIHTIARDFLDEEAARAVLGADYLFLAADSHQARLLFNAIVHQYLLPGCQVGSKVQSDKESGVVEDAFAVHRPMTTYSGCLWCNGVISTERLASESLNEEDLKRQRYLDEEGEPSPSVIALNGIGASVAVNRFMMYLTGLADESAGSRWFVYSALTEDMIAPAPRRDPGCPECGSKRKSRYARGNTVELPAKAVN